MFNQTVRYAFLMLRVLAGNVGHYVRSVEIVVNADVPARYGQEILKDLVKRGILVARKGTGGGNMLPTNNLGLPLSRVLVALDVWEWNAPDLGPDVTADLRKLYGDFQDWAARTTIDDLSAIGSYKAFVTG